MEKSTVYDVAKLANVSVSTVSRVIKHVKKATRDRVPEALKACNFVPDETARGLASHTSKMIVVISDNRTTPARYSVLRGI